MVITILLTVVHCYLHLCLDGAKGFEPSLSPVLNSEANPFIPELLHIQMVILSTSVTPQFLIAQDYLCQKLEMTFLFGGRKLCPLPLR